MKKIVLGESQVDKLMSKLVSEQYAGSDRYSQEVRCSFEYHKKTYKGNEIDWIADGRFNLSFRIDMEARSYGIKGISVYDFQGPEEIEILVTYYPEGSEDPIDEEILIRPDWSKVNTDEADIGWIGIDQDIEMDLINDESGNLIAGDILIHTKEI